MYLVKLQDTRLIYQNLLLFYILVMISTSKPASMQRSISRRPSTTKRPASRRADDFSCSPSRRFTFGFCMLDITFASVIFFFLPTKVRKIECRTKEICFFFMQ